MSRHVLHAADGDVVTVPASARRLTSVSRYDRVLVAPDFFDLANRAIGVAYGLAPRDGVVHLAHVTEASEDTGAVDATHVGEALLQLGARRGVDAICRATHGRTGRPQLVLGSVAQHVVREARCPVVVLPPRSTLLPVALGRT